MKNIFKLSFHYTISNKKAIITLGILIILKETLEKFSSYYHNILIIPITLLMIYFYLYFVGFIGYFVEEVISDPLNQPEYNRKKILRKGIREVIFFTFYIFLSTATYAILTSVGKYYPLYIEQINTIKVLLVSFLNLFPMAAMINVFLHDEDVKYGFKIKEIANLILNLRTSKFIWIIFLSLIVEQLFISNFTYNSGGAIAINGVNLILNLILIPFLYIFLQFIKTIAILISNENKYQDQLIYKK